MTCTGWLPDHPFVMRVRGWFLGRLMRRAGCDLQVAARVRIVGLENLSVGDHVFIANGCWLDAAAELQIEDEVMLGPYVVVVTGNHTSENGSYRFGQGKRQPIRIKKGAWVGAHATVVAGVTIGEGSLVGANAVVTRDVAPATFVGGVPAKVIAKVAAASGACRAG